MNEHKKYVDIERIKADNIAGFEVGDEIYIEEKIDGANCSIQYDSETDSIIACSRKQILTPINNLRGFYEFAQKLDKDKVKSVLGDNLVLFAEWLAPHSIVYPEDKYFKMYAFDLYDRNTLHYLPQAKAVEAADKLGITYVPIFYIGSFVSWDECKKYVGQTKMGGEYSEGIIVKNISKLNNNGNRMPVYLKIVTERFSEKKAHKNKVVKTPEELKVLEENNSLAESIVTRARVEKFLHKFVDEGIIPESWGAKEMGTIAKNLGKRLYDDCVKEEKETVDKIENFGKLCSGIGMKIAKEILFEKEML